MMHMEKDYKKWFPLKVRVHNSPEKSPFFHEREIWFCYLGENVGFEQDGRGNDFLRPVVIIRKFNSDLCWAIPLSKTVKKGSYYFAFHYESTIESVAILSQIRLIDAKRLSYKAGEISKNDFIELKKRLKALLP